MFKFFSCFVLGLLVYFSPGFAVSWVSAEEEGTQQEVLKYLKKLEQDISALRSEVGQLRQAVSEIHRTTVIPKNAPSPSAPTEDADVTFDGAASLGNSDAQIAIVEFTDYECPFCQRFHNQTFSQLKNDYIDSGKIRYFLRNFPLGFHAQAKPAAIAAICAGEQGRYWEMSHELFVNQRRLGPELFDELATQLQFDEANFKSCLKNPAHETRIQTDLTYGQSIGISGTPHFFIGRIEDGKLVKAKRIVGAQPFSQFSRVIDSLFQ